VAEAPATAQPAPKQPAPKRPPPPPRAQDQRGFLPALR
jgi:hypothetical protein